MNSSRAPLRVLERHIYRGPSVYGYRPLTRMVLDLGALEHHPSSELPGFADALLARLPTLHEHGCSYGRHGGFARRLYEGTWLGHIIEHVAIELQNRLGAELTYGKTRSVRGRPGVYDVIYSHSEERVGLLAGRLAIRLVNDLLPTRLRGAAGLRLLVPDGVEPPEEEGAPFDLDTELEALGRTADRLWLGPTSRALVRAARARGIPVRRLDDASLLQLGHGRHARRIRAGVTDATAALAVETAGDKALANRLLEAAGLPVTRLEVVDSADDAVAAAARIGHPVVIKPADGNHGRGVSLDLPDDASVRWAYEQAAHHTRRVVVEGHVPGHDHRLLVVDGVLVAAARRRPAHVIGDGRHTVAHLVDEVNCDPRRGDDHDRPLTRIVLDDHADRMLARQDRTRDSVPAEGERVDLRSTANLSTGGTATDVTDDVHPDNAAIAVRAARTIGLDVAGIDIVAPDLSRPLTESGGRIVEVNAGPGLRMHHAPSHGEPRDAAGPILDMLFPGHRGRIPLIAITGTNGKTTTARMVAGMFDAAGHRVGLATSSGISIAGRKIVGGDTTGPWSAHLVLGDAEVDVAVLETARGGLLRGGLAFDRASVGAVLNVQSDHLGLGGIDTLDDMAWVKSLVAEVTDPGGHTVLNADDPRTLAMRERAGGRVVLFTMDVDHDREGDLRTHIEAGGIAVVRQPSRRGDLLAIIDDGFHTPVMWSHDIPATLDGKATVNVQNALAAIAIGYAAGLSVDTIADGLRSFASTYEQNPGRLNVHDDHPFRTILDYGHNADGLAALSDLVPHLARDGRAIGVITMCGDRRDEDVVAIGRIAAGLFDRVIVREDADRRGREPGEVARLLLRGLAEGGMSESAIDVILPEMEALLAAMRLAAPGDLVMHFADDYEGAWKTITGFRPDVRVPTGASARDLPQRP